MRTIFFIKKELFSREGGFSLLSTVKKPSKKTIRHFSPVKMERPSADFGFCFLPLEKTSSAA